MTEDTGRDNGDHGEPPDSATDEAATSSGWVVTKEAPPPADESAPAQPRARSQVKKRAPQRKPAPASTRVTVTLVTRIWSLPAPPKIELERPLPWMKSSPSPPSSVLRPRPP